MVPIAYATCAQIALSSEARQEATGLKPLEHLRLHARAHVRLGGGVHHRDAREAPRPHHRALVRQKCAPAILHVDSAQILDQPGEDPLEVARARTVAVRRSGRGERRRRVIDVEDHPGGEEGSRGGREERLGEVGRQRGVEERGLGRAGVGRRGECRVRDLGWGGCREGRRRESFFGRLASRAAVRVR